MLFSSAKIFTVVLTVIGSVTAYPTTLERRLPSGQLIGYRVMNSAQAKEWKYAGTVVPGKKIGQRQLGEGQYTTPGIGQWPGPMDRQFCAISANANAWNQAEKAWIPATDTSGNKLWENPINMDMYIKKLQGLLGSAESAGFFSLPR